MCLPQGWGTTDLLGIGILLSEAGRVAQLGDDALTRALFPALLEAALAGLQSIGGSWLDLPETQRLAFRELGLSVGLQATPLIAQRWNGPRPRTLSAIASFTALSGLIESFWLRSEGRSSFSWSAHRNINEVMLATSLVPEAFLTFVDPVTSTKETFRSVARTESKGMR
jgi:hypothetical protein